MAKLRILELTKEQGISQGALSRSSNVNLKTVGQYCNNRVRSISLDNLEKIADVLGVKVTDLIDDEDQESAAGAE